MPSPSTAGGFTRAALRRLPMRRLQETPYYKPDVYVVELGARRAVLKDYAEKPWLIRVLFGRFSIRQEAQALRALEGIEGVPRLLGRPDADSLLISYEGDRPATPPPAGVRNNRAFIAALERIVCEMHRRGVVHFDLKHRSNVLVADDLRPVVIDFAGAFRFRPTWFGGRWLLALFKPIDLMAVRHWKKRICPGALDGDDLRVARRRAAWRKLWWPRWVLDRLHRASGRRRHDRREREAHEGNS